MNQRHKSRGRPVLLTAVWMLAIGACSEAPDDPPAASAVTLFTGAKLIAGDGTVIENATFVVEDGRFTAVGAAGEVPVPDGAIRVDQRGLTVMPAIVDAHTHLGTTREALLEDLRRRASLGIGAALSLGADDLGAPLEMRDETIPGAARYRSAGRGITAPEPGRFEEPHWVTSEEEARQAVRAEAARNVDIIKIWVDDRRGQYQKLSPALYQAVIDEAHAHGLKTIAHIYALEDAKGLLRAGIDAFAHGVRDRDIDDEFLELIRERPEVVLVPNLPRRGVPTDLGWLKESMTTAEWTELQADNVERPERQDAFALQARNLVRLSEAGVPIALGTDGSFWAPHVEMEDMVAAGLSPAEVLIAATRNAAALAGLEDAGTIEVGKRADFVVLEASPLDDITNTRRIVDVYLSGEMVERKGAS
ncbi:MAG TPA: amidohydrolase family protein [Woeseiaceae bacterium]|nr:amidohydrolase family protein [Woeseiaceae bacterium]